MAIAPCTRRAYLASLCNTPCQRDQGKGRDLPCRQPAPKRTHTSPYATSVGHPMRRQQPLFPTNLRAAPKEPCGARRAWRKAARQGNLFNGRRGEDRKGRGRKGGYSLTLSCLKSSLPTPIPIVQPSGAAALRRFSASVLQCHRHALVHRAARSRARAYSAAQSARPSGSAQTLGKIMENSKGRS